MKKVFYILSLLAIVSCGVFSETSKEDSLNYMQGIDSIAIQASKSSITSEIQPGDQLAIAMSTNNGIALFEPGVGGTGQYSQGSQGATAVIGVSTYGQGSGGNTANNPAAVYIIESDSTVKLPSIGRIKLGGMTIRKAETFLEELLSDNYQKPFRRFHWHACPICFLFCRL